MRSPCFHRTDRNLTQFWIIILASQQRESELLLIIENNNKQNGTYRN